ncbi:MAG: hypothetical protein ACREME_09610 [Gemmatimonadales bacterium]
MAKRFVAGGLLLSMVACTTLRPVSDYQTYVSTARPHRVWVTPRDAAPLLLDGPRLIQDTLVGFVDGRYREFAPADVQQVQVRTPARGRTAFLVGAAVVLGAVALSVLSGGGPDTYIPSPEDPTTSLVPRP